MYNYAVESVYEFVDGNVLFVLLRGLLPELAVTRSPTFVDEMLLLLLPFGDKQLELNHFRHLSLFLLLLFCLPLLPSLGTSLDTVDFVFVWNPVRFENPPYTFWVDLEMVSNLFCGDLRSLLNQLPDITDLLPAELSRRIPMSVSFLDRFVPLHPWWGVFLHSFFSFLDFLAEGVKTRFVRVEP